MSAYSSIKNQIFLLFENIFYETIQLSFDRRKNWKKKKRKKKETLITKESWIVRVRRGNCWSSMKSWRGTMNRIARWKNFKKRGGRIRVEIIICRRWLPGSTGLAQTVNFRGITVILLIVRFYVGVLPSSGSTESLLHIFLWTTIFFFSFLFFFQSKKKYRWNDLTKRFFFSSRRVRF